MNSSKTEGGWESQITGGNGWVRRGAEGECGRQGEQENRVSSFCSQSSSGQM